VFDPTSRYFNLETATFITADGRQIAYRRRRFLPQGEDLPLLVEVTVTEGDRLDNLTAQTIGNPEHFWRVADANNSLNPFELTDEPGRNLRIPIPQA